MITIIENASLLPFNTFGIDAVARRLVEYETVDELLSLLPVEGRVLHVGRGSNLLFVSPRVDATVLHSRISGIEIGKADAGGHVVVRVGAGVEWDALVSQMVDRGLGGLENLSLIPGEVGSAAVQNIGAYGVEVSDRIVSVETVDIQTGDCRTFNVGECGYGYRDSIFKHPDNKRFVITHVTMSLDRVVRPCLSYRGLSEALDGIEPTPATVREAVVTLRRSKLPDPAVTGNAGSFFTNPVVDADVAAGLKQRWPQMPVYPVSDGRTVKLSAGWLIERAGWKGRSLGQAGVYDRQALVIVNLGNATGADIARLAARVAADVKSISGVDIYPEVNYI